MVSMGACVQPPCRRAAAVCTPGCCGLASRWAPAAAVRADVGAHTAPFARSWFLAPSSCGVQNAFITAGCKLGARPKAHVPASSKPRRPQRLPLKPNSTARTASGAADSPGPLAALAALAAPPPLPPAAMPSGLRMHMLRRSTARKWRHALTPRKQQEAEELGSLQALLEERLAGGEAPSPRRRCPALLPPRRPVRLSLLATLRFSAAPKGASRCIPQRIPADKGRTHYQADAADAHTLLRPLDCGDESAAAPVQPCGREHAEQVRRRA